MVYKHVQDLTAIYIIYIKTCSNIHVQMLTLSMKAHVHFKSSQYHVAMVYTMQGHTASRNTCLHNTCGST